MYNESEYIDSIIKKYKKSSAFELGILDNVLINLVEKGLSLDDWKQYLYPQTWEVLGTQGIIDILPFLDAEYVTSGKITRDKGSKYKFYIASEGDFMKQRTIICHIEITRKGKIRYKEISNKDFPVQLPDGLRVRIEKGNYGLPSSW